MFHLRTFLMVLIMVRLLMPPGICACKWSSPAARLLVTLAQSDRQIPNEPQREPEDDHDVGCPASPFAVGMGVAPPCEPHLPPALALDLPLPPQSTLSFCSTPIERVVSIYFDAPSTPLYLIVRALLL